jgi:hypothetical protein
MVDIKSKRCMETDCNTRPNFGLPSNKRPSYCKLHATKGMIDIMSKRCELCKSTLMNAKYKPHCADCYFYLNPDDPRLRNYKTKEMTFMSQLKEVFPEIELDRTISGGCSRRRPDGFLDLLTHVIIIEIDENEHKSYESICENRRMMELAQDIGHRAMVIIRLNPDAYTLDGVRKPGAFSVTKATGALKAKPKEVTLRLASLITMVQAYIDNVPDRSVSIEHLFFSD